MMAVQDDSRPFTVLHKMADDFKSTFDSDIKQCLSTLDSQITNLVCDPDPKPKVVGKTSKFSVYVEFSKAKFDIFKNMENFVEQMESSWKSQIQDIAKQFLENVEIFLASTKLESTAKSPTKPFLIKPQSPSLYPSLSSLNPIKHITGTPAQQQKKSPKRLSTSPKKAPATVFNYSNQNNEEVELSESDEEIEISDEEAVQEIPHSSQEPDCMEVEIEPHTVFLKRSALKSVGSTPRNTPDKQVKFQQVIPEEEASTPTQRTRGRPKTAVKTPVPKGTSKYVPVVEEVISIDEPVSTPRGRGRRGAKTNEAKSTSKVVQIELVDSQENGHTPKVQMDIDDDLEIYSPVLNLTRSAPRRKTVLIPTLKDDIPEFNMTPDIVRSRSKRKTMGFLNSSNVSVVPSPKRLKRGGRSSVAPSSLAMEPEEPSVDLLDSDEPSETAVKYSSWISLSDLTGQVPSTPGVYELRVFNAKKPAYIGGCDSLRQKLTLHKLRQATGHKHLDKYVERNHGNVVVRYEVMESLQEAKAEEKNRVNEFSKLYKTTPAYN